MIATMTAGTIAGLIALLVFLAGCVALVLLGRGLLGSYDDNIGKAMIDAGIVLVPVTLACWWWGMAFTLSDDYHSWNVKAGKVERVSKRLVSDGDQGMQERFVVVIAGTPYGVDDTRASLVKEGDVISLRCKKEYQWGVPRSAQGWGCRWNGATA
jgi:hypothetical protein